MRKNMWPRIETPQLCHQSLKPATTSWSNIAQDVAPQICKKLGPSLNTRLKRLSSPLAACRQNVQLEPYLEDADSAIDDVTVLIELDVALERIEVRRLDGISHRMVINRRPGCGDTTDRVEDHLGGVIRGH